MTDESKNYCIDCEYAKVFVMGFPHKRLYEPDLFDIDEALCFHESNKTMIGGAKKCVDVRKSYHCDSFEPRKLDEAKSVEDISVEEITVEDMGGLLLAKNKSKTYQDGKRRITEALQTPEAWIELIRDEPEFVDKVREAIRFAECEIACEESKK